MHYELCTINSFVAKLHHFSQNTKQNACFYIIICVKANFTVKGMNHKLNYNPSLVLKLTIITNLRNLIPILSIFILSRIRELEKVELMRIRDIATCVALGLGVIGRSVSDISQILINSKKSLIL